MHNMKTVHIKCVEMCKSYLSEDVVWSSCGIMLEAGHRLLTGQTAKPKPTTIHKEIAAFKLQYCT